MTVKRVPVTVDWTQTGSSSGLLSARPAASTAGAGYVYTATDTGISYVSNGHDWFNAQVDSISSAPSGSAGGALDGTYPNPGIAASVAGSGLAESSDVLSVNVDGSTIEINTDSLRVKDAGITEAKFGLSDVTTANVSTSAHGLAPKAPSDATKYLDGTGAWSVPAGTGGGGIGAKLYDYEVSGSDKASIDTNVDGTTVADFSGYDRLEVMIIARTDDAAAVAAIDVTVNNDTGANYDRQVIQANNTTVVAAASLAQTKWALNAHGSGGTAGYPTAHVLTIDNYARTVFNKVGLIVQNTMDATAGNDSCVFTSIGWRSTSAITRIKVAAQGAAKLKIGSRLVVFAS